MAIEALRAAALSALLLPKVGALPTTPSTHDVGNLLAPSQHYGGVQLERSPPAAAPAILDPNEVFALPPPGSAPALDLMQPQENREDCLKRCAGHTAKETRDCQRHCALSRVEQTPADGESDDGREVIHKPQEDTPEPQTSADHTAKGMARPSSPRTSEGERETSRGAQDTAEVSGTFCTAPSNKTSTERVGQA